MNVVSLKIPVSGKKQTAQVQGTPYLHTIDEEVFHFVLLNLEHETNVTHHASGLRIPVNLHALQMAVNFALSNEQAASLAIQACIMNQGEKEFADRMRNAKVLNTVGAAA